MAAGATAAAAAAIAAAVAACSAQKARGPLSPGVSAAVSVAAPHRSLAVDL